MKKRRVLVLTHPDFIPPEDVTDIQDPALDACLTEFDVIQNLKMLGHDVEILGVAEDLSRLRLAIEGFKPHICFNLIEEFHGQPLFDQHVVSYLELLKQKYTGCNPRGLTICHDKALCKKILTYHRIPTPAFQVFQRGRKVKRKKNLQFPLLVKSLVEEASLGISQASIVHNDDKLAERVEFIHNKIETDALVEEYIDGRELYLGVMGNTRLTPLPLWETWFENLPKGSAPIATRKVKWDVEYQEKIGLESGPARDIPKDLEKKVVHIAKRAYKALGLSGYARLDFRLSEDGKIYVLEVNPNPDIASHQEFALSAEKSKIKYPELLNKILGMGLGR